MNKLNLEINHELVLSTCHVKQSTFNSEFVARSNYSNDEANVRLHIECMIDDMITENDNDNIQYIELFSLLVLAQSVHCKWLVLDCDGLQVQGLPTFKW